MIVDENLEGWRSGCDMSRTAVLPLAQFSWLWEYKRKLRKIPKKEREKERKEGFPNLLVP